MILHVACIMEKNVVGLIPICCRSEDTESKDLVLPAYQLTLKNLQLDYLDLYLVHGPFALRKGAVFESMTDDDKLGYDPDRVARTWEVS